MDLPVREVNLPPHENPIERRPPRRRNPTPPTSPETLVRDFLNGTLLTGPNTCDY